MGRNTQARRLLRGTSAKRQHKACPLPSRHVLLDNSSLILQQRLWTNQPKSQPPGFFFGLFWSPSVISLTKSLDIALKSVQRLVWKHESRQHSVLVGPLLAPCLIGAVVLRFSDARRRQIPQTRTKTLKYKCQTCRSHYLRDQAHQGTSKMERTAKESKNQVGWHLQQPLFVLPLRLTC